MPSIVLPDLVRNSASPFATALVQEWPTLLIADGDMVWLAGLVRFFEKRGYHVGSAGTLSEAKSLFLRRKSWTMVIADFHLPDGTGWEFHTWLRDHRHDTPFLLTSIAPFHAPPSSGMDYLGKPCSLRQLEARVQAVTPPSLAPSTWTVQGAV